MTPAFFTLHADLPREGPGEPADVDWALTLAGVAADADLCDAGCGPGADIPALLGHIPQGRLLAVDTHPPFVAQARAMAGDDPRVTTAVRDMATLEGPFDLIWSAGALYFLGGAAALPRLLPALKPGGVVAFSEPCFFTDTPGHAARAFWEGEDAAVGTRTGIRSKVAAAGFRVLGDRPLSDTAWEAYFRPMEARIAALAPDADSELERVLDEARREIAGWRAARAETGYLLIVARAP